MVQVVTDPGPSHADKLQGCAAVPTRGNRCDFERGHWRFQLESASKMDTQMHLVQRDFGVGSQEAEVANFHKTTGQ